MARMLVGILEERRNLQSSKLGNRPKGRSMGFLYEDYAICRLCIGGKFPIQNPETGIVTSSSLLTVPDSTGGCRQGF